MNLGETPTPAHGSFANSEEKWDPNGEAVDPPPDPFLREASTLYPQDGTEQNSGPSE